MCNRAVVSRRGALYITTFLPQVFHRLAPSAVRRHHVTQTFLSVRLSYLLLGCPTSCASPPAPSPLAVRPSWNPQSHRQECLCHFPLSHPDSDFTIILNFCCRAKPTCLVHFPACGLERARCRNALSFGTANRRAFGTVSHLINSNFRKKKAKHKSILRRPSLYRMSVPSIFSRDEKNPFDRWRTAKFLATCIFVSIRQPVCFASLPVSDKASFPPRSLNQDFEKPPLSAQRPVALR